MRFKTGEVRKDYLKCHNEEFGFNLLGNWELLKVFLNKEVHSAVI